MEAEIVAHSTGEVVDSAFPAVRGVPRRPMAGEVENDATAFADQLTEYLERRGPKDYSGRRPR